MKDEYTHDELLAEILKYSKRGAEYQLEIQALRSRLSARSSDNQLQDQLLDLITLTARFADTRTARLHPVAACYSSEAMKAPTKAELYRRIFELERRVDELKDDAGIGDHLVPYTIEQPVQVGQTVQVRAPRRFMVR